MSKLMEIEKRYEQLEECVIKLATVGVRLRPYYLNSIHNEIRDLCIEHKKLIQKIEKSKKPYVRLLPCTCGGKKRSLWTCWADEYDTSQWYYKCLKCGAKGYYAKSAEKAKVAWNDMIIGKTERDNNLS